MVTAEFAVGLLAVIPLLLSLVALTGIGATQVKVVEAARTGARLMARGESELVARDQVRAIVPAADVTTERDAGRVSFVVTQRVGGQGMLPVFTLRASAVSPVEGSG
jgi:Flp pilus assembly protein TadG